MGAPLVHAVDIRLYWDMFAAGCDDTSSYSQCSNIAAGVCCSYTSGVFAVKGIGLDTVGVPDQVRNPTILSVENLVVEFTFLETISLTISYL